MTSLSRGQPNQKQTSRQSTLQAQNQHPIQENHQKNRLIKDIDSLPGRATAFQSLQKAATTYNSDLSLDTGGDQNKMSRKKLEEIGKLPSYSTACDMDAVKSRAYVTQAPSQRESGLHARPPLFRTQEVESETDLKVTSCLAPNLHIIGSTNESAAEICGVDETVPDVYSKVKAYLNLDPDLMLDVTQSGDAVSDNRNNLDLGQGHVTAPKGQQCQLNETYAHFQQVDSFEDNECLGETTDVNITSTRGSSLNTTTTTTTTTSCHPHNVPKMTSRIQNTADTQNKDFDSHITDVTSRTNQRTEAGSPTSSVYDNVAYQWQPKSGSRVHHFHF